MIFIHDDLRLGKQFMHQFTVSAGHVHYNKLHSFTVVVFEQIVTDHIMFSVWKNVYDPPVLRISENTLEFLALCISSELIDSQNLRELACFKIDFIDDPGCCRRWHIVLHSNTFNAAALLKLLEDLHAYSVSKLSISRQKIYTFIESFATFRTYMTAFSKVKNGIISWYGNIFYKLSAVIVDFACDGSAARAEVHSLFHSEPYMHFTALTFNICYNYIF